MDTRDLELAYVGEGAIAWDQARRHAARLRAERASMRCDLECEAEYDDMGRMTYGGDPACWRNVWQDQQGRDCRPPVTEWCEPCRQRQAIHEAYTKAVAHRQGLMRGLQRRALAAWESRQAVDAVARCPTSQGEPSIRDVKSSSFPSTEQEQG